MARTLVHVPVHLIFLTKDRAPVIRPDFERETIEFLPKREVEYDER